MKSIKDMTMTEKQESELQDTMNKAYMTMTEEQRSELQVTMNKAYMALIEHFMKGLKARTITDADVKIWIELLEMRLPKKDTGVDDTEF